MQLIIYNSKTNKKEVFEPIDPNSVRMYVCGPTVYNEIHVGNARAAIVFDLLFRVLKVLYSNVIYVRNITDIDDKIIDRAKDEGKTISEVSEHWTESYINNCKRLQLLPPTYQPKATETIKEIISFIEKLIVNGYAYEKDGSVFFSVKKLEGYGSLSHNLEVITNHRVSRNDSKDEQQDFVLWKASAPLDPAWESPWGKGRPGWHIECSAMSKKFLGVGFDIHAGGADLLFPHHENEQAQNTGCDGPEAGPRYWMHNAMLLLDGEKMSKSLGNILLLSEIFQTLHPVFFKFYILNTHYRHLLSWSDQSIKSLAVKFDNWIMHLGFYFKTAQSQYQSKDLGEVLNDLNFPGFFADFERQLNIAVAADDRVKLEYLAGLLILLGLNPAINEISQEVQSLVELRWQTKMLNDFVAADKLREEIENMGFVLLDQVDGSVLKPKFWSILK